MDLSFTTVVKCTLQELKLRRTQLNMRLKAREKKMQFMILMIFSFKKFSFRVLAMKSIK